MEFNESFLEKTNWANIQISYEEYCWLINNLHIQNEDFIRRFTRFYKINLGLRTQENREMYFELLKTCIESKEDNFGIVLRKLSSITRRNEMSYASKIVANVNQDKIIVDSIVLKNLQLRRPSYGNLENRLNKSIEMYQLIESYYQKILNTTTGKMFLSIFDNKINLTDNFKLTEIKKLDFIIWQTRI